MIQDLPVLENYDVLTSFDGLSQVPAQPAARSAEELSCGFVLVPRWVVR